MPEDKLQRIKESIAARREEPPQDISALIEKIRKKEGKPPAAVAAAQVTAKKSDLDFSRVSIPRAPGVVGLLGKFFISFEGIISKVASSFSSLPMAQELRFVLDAAAIPISAETYVALSVSAGIACALLAILVVSLLGVMLNDALIAMVSPLIGVCVFVLVAFSALYYPRTRASSRAATVDRALPFALRQLSTQVKAGVSFHKALTSIANSNYGVLSEEVGRVVAEINSGETTEGALKKLSKRTFSKGLKRMVTQINRSFKTGGNLSQIISDIADDVSFETRMSIRDFTEKLNFINIIYIMVSVVAPVVVAILSAIMQIPLFAGTLPDYFVYAAFMAIVAAMLGIVFVTKKMEPAAW